MASKLKKALKKIGKAALIGGAGYLAMKGLGKRKQNKDFLKTEGGDKSDMRDYGPYSKKAAPKTRSNASIAGDFITKVNNPKKMESGMQMSNDLVSSKLPSRTRTPIKADNSGIIKQYKSGGRANYKHGGSTGSSKSSGCEIRGTSPILMKGKR